MIITSLGIWIVNFKDYNFCKRLILLQPLPSTPSLLRAKPVVLMTSYLTKDFVEEQENGCPIGQLYIQMYAVRGR